MKSINIPILVLAVAAICVCSARAARQGGLKAGIRFGVCDWTMGKTGDPAALELASKLGLEGVQVSLSVKNDALPLAQGALQKSYLEVSRRTGVSIASFAIGDLNDIPYKSDPRAERWLDESIDICRAMGVKIILVPFFGKGDLRKDPAGTAVVIERLRRVAPKAEKAGVILALESWLSADDHLKIIEAVGSPAVQVYYDVGNSQEAGYDIRREIRQLGSRNMSVPCQGLQKPIREGHNGLYSCSGGHGGDWLSWLVRFGRDRTPSRYRAEHPL